MSDSRYTDVKITISKNGPYLVEGSVKLSHIKGVQVKDHMEFVEIGAYEHDEEFALCRCGKSKNPPFCDGSHIEANFHGDEVASRLPYKERAEEELGPELILLDDERCAFARFCHRAGQEVWTLTEESDNAKEKTEAIKAASDCPAGRLVAYERESGRPYEIQYEPEIAVYEDVQRKASGPLNVRGHISLISEDGTEYELRNRYSLCRCGNSRNKPFCDATHVPSAFNATLE
jgi:CDGSH-type Zn-finger protein